MAVTLVQTKLLEQTLDLDGTAGLVLDATPASGNILVASVVARRNNMSLVLPPFTNASVKTGVDNWSLIQQRYTAADDLSAGHRGGLFWKVAGVSEGTTITLDTDSTDTDLSLEIFEFAHDFVTPVISTASAGFMVTSSASDPSVSTGSTGIAESAPVLWVGLASIRNGTPSANAAYSPAVNEAGHSIVNGRWISEFGWLESQSTDAQDWTWTIDNWLTASRWAMLSGFIEGGTPPDPDPDPDPDPTFTGSFVRIPNQAKARVRLSDQRAASVRLSDISRLE